MDQPKRPSEKTYSDVMNEWAAQRHFVNANRSRLLHPPYEAHPVAKFIGYLMRVGVLVLIPLAVYLLVLRSYLTSNAFNDSLSSGIARTMDAGNAEARGTQWKLSGILSVKSLEAKGGPGAFYEEFEARTIGTRISFPHLFRREWILPRVSIGELSIALRSGAVGKVPLYQPDENDVKLPAAAEMLETPTPKTSALRSPMGRSLRAGYGVNPDFGAMRINSLQTAQLNVTWGTGPATSGAVTGMQTDFTKSAAGWIISGNGGQFHQSWLDGLKVEKLHMQLGASEAVINEAVFSRKGGGRTNFTGRVVLGEMPEVTGVMQLDGVALQDLVPAAAGGFFTAEVKGLLNLTGSVNRAAGVRMEGDLELQSGRINALPVLKVLEHLTGENQFRLLTLRSGRIQFVTSGTEAQGGLLVEVKHFEADCGALLRLKGSLRYEVTKGIATIDGKVPPDVVKATGLIRLGLAPSLSVRLKPAVANRFLKVESDGWSWLDLIVDDPLNGTFTQAIAAEMQKAARAVP